MTQPGATNDGRYAIVGAGPAGLATSRALARLNIDHVVYEKHSDVGGIWDIENPGSPMYESAHFISSRFVAGFGGFPMPADYPDYPNHRQVLRYLRQFSERYNLQRHVVPNAHVVDAAPVGGDWRLTLADGRVATHRGIVCANGVTWLPNMPEWPGEFGGEIRHASTYRSPQEFVGKRVLIVGLGNSGADIACDAARHAQQATVSVRRGYHFIPKHLHGWPTDLYFRQRAALPEALKDVDALTAIRAVVGDPTRFGMPMPDHELGQAHALMNSQFLHHLGHGDITVRPDIAALDGKAVVFADGSRLEVDLILAATGYQVRAPYVDDALFEIRGQRVQQYMNVFHRQQHELFTVGFAEVAAGIYPLFDEMAHLLAHHLHDRLRRPAAAQSFESWKQEDDFNPRGKLTLVDSDRHANYIDLPAYRRHAAKLCEQFGWPVYDPAWFSTHASLPA